MTHPRLKRAPKLIQRQIHPSALRSRGFKLAQQANLTQSGTPVLHSGGKELDHVLEMNGLFLLAAQH